MILLAAGIALIFTDILMGGGSMWIVIFPFIFRGGPVGALGVLLVFLGFLLWVLAHVRWQWEGVEEGGSECEGVVLIGPVPIFLRGHSAVLVPLLIMLLFLTVFLAVLFFIIML